MLEGFEHAGEISWRHADAGVADRDDHSGFRVEPARDLNMAAGTSEFDRVSDEVEQNVHGLAFVGAHQWQASGQLDRA